MSTDLTFITNQDNKSLQERFKILVKSAKSFDC